jgi:hypothetical protein
MKLKFLNTLLVGILFGINANAQTGATSTFEFLRMPVSARAIAMGGYVPAYFGKDLAVASFAPSLLNESFDRNLTLNHEILFGGIQHGQVTYARYNKKANATFAGNIQYINYGDFTRTDETGATHGHFGAQETALQLGFGKKLNPVFSYGVNAKLVASKFDDLLATGLAADLSTTYCDTAKRLTVTMMIKNFGLQLKNFQPNDYRENFPNEAMPTDVMIGVSKRLAHLPFALNITAHHLTTWNIRYNNPADEISTTTLNADTTSTKPKKYIGDKIFRHINFGGEFYLGKSVTMQIGYNNLRRQELKTSSRNGLIGFSGGFQVRTKKFTIGYGRAWYYLPSASNTLSLTFNI